MRNYLCRVLDVKPDGYDRERNYFITEDIEHGPMGGLELTIQGMQLLLSSWLFLHPEKFIGADMSAVRFLPEGIGVVRGCKYVSKHERNPWPAAWQLLDSGWPNQYLFRVNHDGSEATEEMISSCFDSSGVWIRPGKFAKALGCTDSEAEEFARDYNRVFLSKLSDSYELSMLEGDGIVDGYNGDNYAYRNDSPLWSSCMNGKRNIIRWYAKNKKNVKLAVLKKDGRIVARSVIWLDTTISEWGDSSYHCTSDKVLYKGMFADRVYYHDDDALDVMFAKFKELGIAHKRSTSYGAGALSIQVDGTFDDYHSGCLLVSAKVSFVGGLVPYLDTLPFASSNRTVNNRCVDGKIKQCTGVNGNTNRMGEYVKVTLGLDDEDAKYGYRVANNVSTIVMPDGSRVHGYGSRVINQLGASVWCAELGGHFVISAFTTEQTISVARNTGWGSRLDTITAHVYAHQLEFDVKSGQYRVARLFDIKSGEYHPVNEFVIKYTGRGYRRTQKLIRDKKLASKIWSSIQVDGLPSQPQTISVI
jgi:hypothetical protein